MLDPNVLQDLDLSIRHFVYQHFAHNARPPSIIEAAAAFNLTAEETRAAYTRLHANHLIFLEPGSTDIRMANPFSAVKTDFEVKIGRNKYWANCAWDMLGIPAALQKDALITAIYEDSREENSLAIEDGQLQHNGGLVHFPLPVRKWYDDLIFT